jgi:hypothetical protein
MDAIVCGRCGQADTAKFEVVTRDKVTAGDAIMTQQIGWRCRVCRYVTKIEPRDLGTRPR